MGKKNKTKKQSKSLDPNVFVNGNYSYITNASSPEFAVILKPGECILKKYLGKITLGQAYTLPLTIDKLNVYLFSDSFFTSLTGIRKLIIPKGFSEHYIDFLDSDLWALSTVSEFIVEEGTEGFHTIDGVLFYNDILVRYPPLKEASEYSIPDGTTMIASCAFYGARNLETIFISGSVEDIEEDAFARCNKMKSIEIPENVTHTMNSLFTECASLESVDFRSCSPEVYIESSDFFGCPSLKSIKINEDNPVYCVQDDVVYMRPGVPSIFDKKRVRDKYRLVYYPSNKSGDTFIIPENVGYISSFAFVDNRNLVNIKAFSLPDVNDYAFEGSKFDLSSLEVIGNESSEQTQYKERSTNSSEDEGEASYLFPDTLVTVADKFVCIHNGHHLKDKKVKLRMVDPSNHLHDIVIKVGYCVECSRYYLYTNLFEQKLASYLNSGWKLIGTQFLFPGNRIVGYRVRKDNGSMATESVLKMCGYSVGNSSMLSDLARLAILTDIIKKELLSKQEIMSYLNHFIEYNGKAPDRDMSQAIADWKHDLLALE